MSKIRYKIVENKAVEPHSFYAIAIATGKLSFEDICEEASDGKSVTPAIMRMCVSEYMKAARRELIKSAIELHRYKGTPWAVRRALELLGLRVDVQEWFDIGSAPYTFRVRVAVTGPINWESVARTIDAWKPAGRGYAVHAAITPSDPGELTPDSWPKTQLIHPRAGAAMGIVHVRQPARRVPLVMPRAAAGVGVVRIRHAGRAAQITQPRAAAALGIIRLGTLPLSSS